MNLFGIRIGMRPLPALVWVAACFFQLASAAGADVKSTRTTLLAAFDQNFAGCKEFAEVHHRLLASAEIGKNASEAFEARQAVADDLEKSQAVRIARLLRLEERFAKLRENAPPALKDDAFGMHLEMVALSLQVYCMAVRTPTTDSSQEFRLITEKMEERIEEQYGQIPGQEGEEEDEGGFTDFDDDAPTEEDGDLAAPTLWKSKQPRGTTEVMSPEKYEEKKREYAEHLREREQQELQNMRVRQEREAVLAAEREARRQPEDGRMAAGLNEAARKELASRPVPVYLPPEQTVDMRAWHTEYAKVMKPLKAQLGFFVSYDRRVLSSTLLQVCGKLMDLCEKTAKDLKALKPSPLPELDAHLKKAVAEFNQMSYNCASGDPKKTDASFKAAEKELGQAAQILVPYQLKP